MLQDRLDGYIDVDVGDAKKVEPAFLVEEKIDYLIIGDNITKRIPSLEIQEWLLKYRDLSKQKKFTLKAISGYYVALANIKVKPFWDEVLHDNAKTDFIYPPILHLKIDKAGLELENEAFELIRRYSIDFIEWIINNKKMR